MKRARTNSEPDQEVPNLNVHDEASEERGQAEPGAEAPEANPLGAAAGESASSEFASGPEAKPSIEQLEERVQSLRDSLLRAKADYKNLERRSSLERTDAIRYANGELMRSLLGVVDDLERSLSAMRDSEAPPSVVDGVRLVYENFLKALRTHGLEPIEGLHQPFDPQLHEALLQQPSDEHTPGTVIEEVARGYRLRDRVIRPAKVVVSKSTDEHPHDGRSDGDSSDDSKSELQSRTS